MSKKDGFWETMDDYLTNPLNEERQHEDYLEFLDEEANEKEWFEEQDTDFIDDDDDDDDDVDDDEY